MLIKKIYFFVAMLFATQLVMAQYKLSGKITDFDTQEPVKNASVYLVDLKKSTVSDQNGNYAFQNLKSGKYFVEITGDNYTSLLVSIEVNQDAVSNIILQKSAKEIDEVVVTAVTRASELKRFQ